MATTLDTLKINVQADTGQADKSLSSLKEKGEKLSSMGTKLTLGLTTPIIAMGTASLMTAANVSEMESKFNTVFKTTSKSAEKWAETYGDAIGRSKYELMEATSNQADLMIGMGMTEKVAGSLSQNYTELAYDLASFNNVNDKTAVEAMTKAMMGETEMAKQLGLNLSETVMANSDYVKSTGKSWKEMDMAEKAQARYHEALKQSTNAIGDAERTQGSFTNQLKRMKGIFFDLSKTIGDVLLPTFEKILTKFNEMLMGVDDFIKENPKLAQTIVAIGGALAALGPSLVVVGKVMGLVSKFAILGPILTGVAVALGVVAVAFIGLNENAQTFIAELPSKIFDGLNIIMLKIQESLPIIFEKGYEILMKLIEGLTVGIPILLEFIGTMVVGLIDTITTFLPSFISMGMEFILKLLNGVVTALPSLVSGIVNGIIDLVLKIGEQLPSFLQKGFEIITNVLDGVIGAIPSLISGLWNGITSLISSITQRMPEFLSRGLEFISKMTQGIAQNLPSILSKMWEVINLIIAKIIEGIPKFIVKGGELIVAMVKGLWDNRDKILSIMGDILTALLGAAFEGIKGFVNIGVSIVKGIRDGIANAWDSFVSWLTGKLADIPIIGALFRGVDGEQQEGLEGNGVAPIGINYGLKGIARGMGLENPFVALNKRASMDTFNLKLNKKLFEVLDTKKEEKEVASDFTLNIENFNNNREQDVQELAEELEFYRNNYTIQRG